VHEADTCIEEVIALTADFAMLFEEAVKRRHEKLNMLRQKARLTKRVDKQKPPTWRRGFCQYLPG
jgi:hypothetical protein